MPSAARAAAFAISLLLAAPGAAAPPAIPTSLPFQGLLLDGLGAPRTGSVELTLRIWDAVVGGTLVYKQGFPAVALEAGVFTVQLGPTGEGSDLPAAPLTTDLATALAGDAGATAPVRFLEVTVGSDGPLTRTQILASAYALRANSAATADSAALADDVVRVNGVDAGFVSELVEHVSFDGGDPPNADSREGLADVDGDGLANFVDPDNDDDGVSDAAELAAGTDINLVTLGITGLAPSSLFYTSTGVVTVSGHRFEPGLAVQFGSETPVPFDLSSTSFRVTVGPQPAGVVDVTVTNPNGQGDSVPFTFSSSLAHSIALAGADTTIDVRTGTDQVILGGALEYGVGVSAETEFPLASCPNGSIAVAWAPSGAVAGLRGRSAGGCNVEILVDSDADRALEDETGIPIETMAGTLLGADLVADPAGRWVAAYMRALSGTDVRPVIAHDRNGDGDFADTNELSFPAGPFTTSGNTGRPDLAVDSAGRVMLFYGAGFSMNLLWDRNGDGDFEDAAEKRSAVTSGNAGCSGAAFDALDRPVLIWSSSLGTTTRLIRDLTGDGDFFDAGEDVALAPGTTVTGCDVAAKPGQPLVVMHDGGGALQLLVDENGDGDFADAGEVTAFAEAASPSAVLGVNGIERAVVALPTKVVIGTTQ
jgi:hypothetical protein